MTVGKPPPGVVRCMGVAGCRQTLDLGVDPALRGTRIVEHLRNDPAHEGRELIDLVAATVFVPA